VKTCFQKQGRLESVAGCRAVALSCFPLSGEPRDVKGQAQFGEMESGRAGSAAEVVPSCFPGQFELLGNLNVLRSFKDTLEDKIQTSEDRVSFERSEAGGRGSPRRAATHPWFPSFIHLARPARDFVSNFPPQPPSPTPQGGAPSQKAQDCQLCDVARWVS